MTCPEGDLLAGHVHFEAQEVPQVDLHAARTAGGVVVAVAAALGAGLHASLCCTLHGPLDVFAACHLHHGQRRRDDVRAAIRTLAGVVPPGRIWHVDQLHGSAGAETLLEGGAGVSPGVTYLHPQCVPARHNGGTAAGGRQLQEC